MRGTGLLLPRATVGVQRSKDSLNLEEEPVTIN